MKVQTLYNYHASQRLLGHAMKQSPNMATFVEAADDNTQLQHRNTN
jgi:hypothetical protein